MPWWKQSSGAAHTAADFKGIPFPGHQPLQPHGKRFLILPLLSSSLMVFMYSGPHRWGDLLPQHTRSAIRRNWYNWQWSCSQHWGCESIKHPLYYVYCSLLSFTEILAFLIFFLLSKNNIRFEWHQRVQEFAGDVDVRMVLLITAYKLLHHRLTNICPFLH